MHLNSSGVQQRNFITVSDIAQAVIHFLHLPSSNIHDGLFNLGGPRSYSLIEMANMIAERSQAILGHIPDLTHAAQQPTDSHQQLDFKIDKLIASGFVAKTISISNLIIYSNLVRDSFHDAAVRSVFVACSYCLDSCSHI